LGSDTVPDRAPGAEALAAIGAVEPTVVVTAWTLPDMPCDELIRAAAVGRDTKPSVVVIADTTEADVVAATVAGARDADGLRVDWLSKPFTRDELHSTLAAFGARP
jgi:DNA-binding response OmpR family regulator